MIAVYITAFQSSPVNIYDTTRYFYSPSVLRRRWLDDLEKFHFTDSQKFIFGDPDITEDSYKG